MCSVRPIVDGTFSGTDVLFGMSSNQPEREAELPEATRHDLESYGDRLNDRSLAEGSDQEWETLTLQAGAFC